VLISFAAAAVGLIIVMWDSENPDSTDEIMTSRSYQERQRAPKKTSFFGARSFSCNCWGVNLRCEFTLGKSVEGLFFKGFFCRMPQVFVFRFQSVLNQELATCSANFLGCQYNGFS
jgi:hypothetical protein